MPVDNSRLKGFYKLNVEQRRGMVADLANLNDEHIAALAASGELDDASADRMIENVIGTMSLPVGVATNFIIDQSTTSSHFALKNQVLLLLHPTWRSAAMQREDSVQTTMPQ